MRDTNNILQRKMNELYIITKSPARISLLKNLGLDIEVINLDIKEKILRDPVETVLTNALEKFKGYSCGNCLKASFDTVIFLESRIIGKPKGRRDAFRILKLLSGKMHKVYTGFVVGYENNYIKDYECTKVYFRRLTDDEIYWYLSKNEYIGAAGAYRIQGYGKLLVEKIEGDYFNVVGLPLVKFFAALYQLGIDYRKLI